VSVQPPGRAVRGREAGGEEKCGTDALLYHLDTRQSAAADVMAEGSLEGMAAV